MHTRFDVYLADSLICIIYDAEEVSARDMRRRLLAERNSPPKISVYRYAVGRPALDDMARASHPEEL